MVVGAAAASERQSVISPRSHMRTFVTAVLLIAVCAFATIAQTTAPSTQPASTQPAATQPAATKENWQSLKKGMSLDEVKAVMGEPTQVDDLQQGFAGLSPTEDGFLVRNRSKLSKRAVWYLKKNGQSPNLNDVWFSVYFGRADDKLVAKLSNPPEKR